MIVHGARPSRVKHTDYDFLKNHRRFGVSGVRVKFANEFFSDAGLTMPNQNETDAEYTPPTPPMPYGCTDFIQSELPTDITKQIHNPNELEAITGANARGGYDIRASLDAARAIGWIKQYFNVRAAGLIDFFDAFRLAQVAGVNLNEQRSISWGTPWFPSWEDAILKGKTIMPMPTNDELRDIRAQTSLFGRFAGLWGGTSTIPWHNSKLDGWTTKEGTLVYRNKSLQGNQIGEKGFIFFTRDVINMVMTIRGTVAFTASNTEKIDSPQTIDVNTLQWLVSLLQTLIARYVK